MPASASPTINQQFARFICATRADTLPTSVAAFAADRILDTLSTAIAAHGLPVPGVAEQIIAHGAGDAVVIGSAHRAPPADAAFVNATLVNGRTQDDFLCKSHPGAVTLPAALAIADTFGGSGADLLAAVVAGYEITARVYLGGPGMLPRFRATGVAGTVGAAAAAARMLKLDETRTTHALGLGAIFACGFGAGFLSGTMDVKLNVGMAARNGVTAALLANAGATASPRALEGDAGYYKAISNGIEHIASATAQLGERYVLEETIYKEFPICIFIQTPMTLALAIANETRLVPEKIGRVIVTVCDLTYTNPGFTNPPPYASSLQARVAARFCLAAALLGRPIGDFAFYEQHDDPDVLALAARIELVCDPSRTDLVTVSVEHDGQTLTVEGSEGATLKPTREKIRAKFRRLVASLPCSRADEIEPRVLHLDQLQDVRELTRYLCA